MLILTRKHDENVIISTLDGATRIKVAIVDIRGDKVRLGIEAPRQFSVHRAEVQAKIDAQAAAPLYPAGRPRPYQKGP